MQRLMVIFSSMGLLVLANAIGLTLGAVLATLGIGLMTAVCLAPVVFLSELISRRSQAPGSHKNGTTL